MYPFHLRTNGGIKTGPTKGMGCMGERGAGGQSTRNGRGGLQLCRYFLPRQSESAFIRKVKRETNGIRNDIQRFIWRHCQGLQRAPGESYLSSQKLYMLFLRRDKQAIFYPCFSMQLWEQSESGTQKILLFHRFFPESERKRAEITFKK